MDRERGLVHLYWGRGKGKTTAAVGLALRALGQGRTVAVVQFLKDGGSGEIAPLRQLGAQVFSGKQGPKFVSAMTPTEKAEIARQGEAALRAAMEVQSDLLILDELCAVRRHGLLDEGLAKAAVLNRPWGREVVITGRDPEPWMLEAADYITEMQCQRHPYDQGVAARRGIEY